MVAMVEIPVISCPECREAYGLAEWRALDIVQTEPIGWGSASKETRRGPGLIAREFRSCTCGHTMAVPVAILQDAAACGGFFVPADQYAELYPMSNRQPQWIDEPPPARASRVFTTRDVAVIVAASWLLIAALVAVALWVVFS